MNPDVIRDAIRMLLVTNNYGMPLSENFGEDESLFEKGIVDSFGLFSLVTDIQKHFSIVIYDREIYPQNFETITNMVSFVAKKM